MSLEIEDGKATDIANPVDMDSEFSEKVDNFFTTVWQREP
jgi:hypothetical protein